MEAWWTQSELVGFGTLLAVVMTVVVARRNDSAPAEAFALLGMCGVAAAAGGRAWALAAQSLSGVAAAFVWDPFAPAGYASAGALIGASVVLIAARFIYGRDEFGRAADAVVPGGLLGLAFARAGCVVQGCDVGPRLDASWATHYPNGHPVFEEQLAAGLLDATASHALGVHPFGYYIALPLVGIAIAGALVRLSPGRSAVACAAGYGVVRFVAEFWREPAARELAVGPIHLGHYIAIGVIVAAAAYLLWDGRHSE